MRRITPLTFSLRFFGMICWFVGIFVLTPWLMIAGVIAVLLGNAIEF